MLSADVLSTNGFAETSGLIPYYPLVGTELDSEKAYYNQVTTGERVPTLILAARVPVLGRRPG